MGIGSQTHHMAVSTVMPAVHAAALPRSNCTTHQPTSAPSNGPSQRAIFFITYLLYKRDAQKGPREHAMLQNAPNSATARRRNGRFYATSKSGHKNCRSTLGKFADMT